MKRLAIVVIVLGLILGGMALIPSTTEYVAPEVVEVEKEVQVDALEKTIKDAQDAKVEEVKTKAQEAYDAAYTHEMKTIELEVISEFGKKLDARQIELEKETKVF